MKLNGIDVGRHGLQVAVFCAAVALLTRSIWPGEVYGVHLLKSLSVGLIIWLVIEFGRLLVHPRHCYVSNDRDHGWPRGWRGVLLAGAGTLAGFLLGGPLGAWLTGTTQPHSLRERQAALLITIAAGAIATFYFYARGHAAALAADKAVAERDAGEARLLLLQSQLEPHMLFNTLANLRALIATDPAAAQTMLDRLDSYLRATLAASRSATEHPLAAEFERLSDYLELMRVRMDARLRVRLELPEALRAVPVPPLLLQPLVENAIRHGLEPCVPGGQLRVDARQEADCLILTVADTGCGFDPHQQASDGQSFGLAQVRERVASSTRGRGHVDLQSTPGRGTTVRISLPLTS